MVSLIQSNYEGFGSGLVVPGLGFGLQDRGSLFNMEAAPPPPRASRFSLQAAARCKVLLSSKISHGDSLLSAHCLKRSTWMQTALPAGGLGQPVRAGQAPLPHHYPWLRDQAGRRRRAAQGSLVSISMFGTDSRWGWRAGAATVSTPRHCATKPRALKWQEHACFTAAGMQMTAVTGVAPRGISLPRGFSPIELLYRGRGFCLCEAAGILSIPGYDLIPTVFKRRTTPPCAWSAQQ